MAFNSHIFILGFLPAAYLGFLLAHRFYGWRGAYGFLVAASLAFYAQSSVALVSVLVISAIGNYSAGRIIAAISTDRRMARAVLLWAIAANVAALGYFKYTNFLIDVANQISGQGYSHISLIVPIGVSFFTFVQIGYLIEVYNGQVKQPTLDRYLLFVTFFPTVTAGPLTLQREMLDQMEARDDRAFEAQRLAIGLTLFGIGLFKKVVLADSIAPHANLVFDGVASGAALGSIEAWVGAVCYALQLYFDFSGYSDMAIGLGYMFGLRIPLNFDSPFKATSISDFWRRWHMTMTRFFMTYVYTPIAMRGMRRTAGMKGWHRFIEVSAVPAIATFLVAGIWHGAGWTFVIYGLLHGTAIAVNSAWRDIVRIKLPEPVCWALTMGVVVSGLVIFRADDLNVAWIILGKMWTGNLLVDMSAATSSVTLVLRDAVSLIVLLGSVVLLMPNSQEILHRNWVSTSPMPKQVALAAGLLAWRPNMTGAVATAVCIAVAITSIGASSTFLYYQF